MAKFKVENDGFKTKAFKVVGGHEDVKPGDEKIIDFMYDPDPDFIASMKKDGVKITAVKEEAKAKA